MCLILDANKYGEFLDPNNQDMKPVRNWIEKNGKIVHAPTEKLEQELNNHQGMKNQIHVYRKAGRVKIITKEEVNKAAIQLTNLVSNDTHIIALAIASNTKLLVSGDKNLHTDFQKEAKGKIYQNKKHKRLLRRDTCP